MDCVPNMGLRRDMAQHLSLTHTDDVKHCSRVDAAREAVYGKNRTVDSTAVENLLKEDSLVPTAVSWSFYCVAGVNVPLFQNAFSDKLSSLNFNMFEILVVDLMHKVELSVWKAVFIHLLRLLDCKNETLKYQLDQW